MNTHEAQGHGWGRPWLGQDREDVGFKLQLKVTEETRLDSRRLGPKPGVTEFGSGPVTTQRVAAKAECCPQTSPEPSRRAKLHQAQLLPRDQFNENQLTGIHRLQACEGLGCQQVRNLIKVQNTAWEQSFFSGSFRDAWYRQPRCTGEWLLTFLKAVRHFVGH